MRFPKEEVERYEREETEPACRYLVVADGKRLGEIIAIGTVHATDAIQPNRRAVLIPLAWV